ncbi:hypothetical protein CBL_21162, partial [Carabus blaptoides fortunei]
MLQPGKMQEIVDEIKRYRVDIVAIQETRWKGQSEIRKSDFVLKYSGAEEQGQLLGVGFIIMGKMKDKIIEFKPIDENKEKFYELIEEELESIPKEDTRLIMGDFNAQIGKEKFIEKVAGKHTIHVRTNNNGQRLCNLAASTDLVISSTKHKKWHKVTWTAPDQ